MLCGSCTKEIEEADESIAGDEIRDEDVDEETLIKWRKLKFICDICGERIEF